MSTPQREHIIRIVLRHYKQNFESVMAEFSDGTHIFLDKLSAEAITEIHEYVQQIIHK